MKRTDNHADDVSENSEIGKIGQTIGPKDRQPMEDIMTFPEWIQQQQHRTDHVGRVARKAYAWDADLYQTIDNMVDAGASGDDTDAVFIAFTEEYRNGPDLRQ